MELERYEKKSKQAEEGNSPVSTTVQRSGFNVMDFNVPILSLHLATACCRFHSETFWSCNFPNSASKFAIISSVGPSTTARLDIERFAEMSHSS